MRLLLDRFRSAETAWSAMYTDLLEAGLDARTADAVLAARRTTGLDAEMERLDKAGVRALTWESENYPEGFREVSDAPPVLYALVIEFIEWSRLVTQAFHTTAGPSSVPENSWVAGWQRQPQPQAPSSHARRYR